MQHHMKMATCIVPRSFQVYKYYNSAPKKSTTSCYVCYVDYGNFATVNKSDLYELPEELMKIEGVAKRGRLYAIGKLMSEDKQA